MHVPRPVGAGSAEELLPVAVGGLVRADLRRDDALVDRDTEVAERGRQEVGIGVRERRQLPAAGAQLGEGAGNLGKRLPTGERLAERVLVS